MMRKFALALAITLASPLIAQDNSNGPYADTQLTDPVAEAKASDLMETLRCVQCQGQSIADSDAPIAASMRNEVRQRILNGEAPADIRAWLISRYGEYISFEPSFSGPSMMLWLLPLMLFLVALFLARGVFVVRDK